MFRARSCVPIFLLACADPMATPALGAEELVEPQRPASFRFDELAQNAHFAFRSASGSARAGDERARIDVDARGRLSFAPLDPGGALQPWLELETIALAATSAPEIEADGSVRVERGRVVEHLRYQQSGLEQSWSFAEPTEGPLEIRVSVGSLRHVAETDEGHHFADASGQSLVRYGHASWVDADSQRTPIRVELEGDALVMRVPAEVVAASRFPAVLDPVITPEIAVDTPVASGFVAEAIDPDVAFGAGTFLVVWQDARADRFVSWPEFHALPRARPTGSSTIYAARLSSAGALLDSAGIELGAGTLPAVAYAGSAFGVVWEGVSGPAQATRVWPNGAYDPVPTAIGGLKPDIVGTPSGTFIVVSTDGAQLGYSRLWNPGVGVGLPASLAMTCGTRGPSIAWDDVSAMGLVACSDGTVRARRVNILGGPAGAIVTLSPPGGRSAPVVAAGNGRALVAYYSNVAGPSNVAASRVNMSTGASMGSANLTSIAQPIPTLAGAPWLRPAAAYRSTNDDFYVAWADERAGSADLYRTRVPGSTGAGVSPNGTLLAGGPGIPIMPALASGDATTSYLVTWTEGSAPPPVPEPAHNAPVRGARITGADTVSGSPFLVSAGANAQTDLAIAQGSTRSLLVAADSRGNGDIVGWLLDASGAPISGTLSIPIATGAAEQTSPDVAWNGTSFLVVWEEGGNILGSLLDETGTVVSTDVYFDQPNSVYEPRVAGNETNGAFCVTAGEWGVSFNLFYPTHTGYSLLYRVRTAAGVLLNVGIYETQTHVVQHDVAANGSNFTVVHYRYWAISANDNWSQILAGYVDGTTGLFLLGGEATPFNSNLELADINPVAVETEDGALVAWPQIDPVSQGAEELYVRAVDGNSVPLGAPQAVMVAPSSTSWLFHPAIDCEGKYCLAAIDNETRDVRAVVFDPSNGAPLSPVLDIANNADAPESWPAIASTREGLWTVVYQRHLVSPGVNITRAMHRTVSMP